MQPTVIYLHGFVSGPYGTKADFLSDRLAEQGGNLRRPDLNTPDFERMTVTNMVARTAQEVEVAPPGPVTLIGSSLGGFTALQFMKVHRQGVAQRVTRLVLLAPALDFPARFVAHAAAELGPDPLAVWRAAGSIPMFHHAHDRDMPLGYGFVVDLQQWSDAFDVALDVPVLIIHGMQDESVPYGLSVRFAEGKPNVTLHLLGAADHGMNDWLPEIWTQLQLFGAAEVVR